MQSRSTAQHGTTQQQAHTTLTDGRACLKEAAMIQATNHGVTAAMRSLSSFACPPAACVAASHLTSQGVLLSVGTAPRSSQGSYRGSSQPLAAVSAATCCALLPATLPMLPRRRLRLAKMSRVMASACGSSWAKWSVTPAAKAAGIQGRTRHTSAGHTRGCKHSTRAATASLMKA